jgi:glutamate synthase (NADPH/NADH) large chain
MVQIPDAFFRKTCQDMNLPKNGRYGVGMMFFSHDDDERKQIEEQLNTFILAEGQTVLGWRTVPVNAEDIGPVAKMSCPVVARYSSVLMIALKIL